MDSLIKLNTIIPVAVNCIISSFVSIFGMKYGLVSVDTKGE